MQSILHLLKRFRSDERGVFAVLFGLMAIVLIAMGGAVVDYVSLEQSRNRAQVALDAAALALQPQIFKKPLNQSKILSDAKKLVLDRVGGGAALEMENDDIEIDIPNGSLILKARVTVPTLFVSLVGVQELNARLFSEATRKMLDLEVMMVLDNSGSMAGSKMSNLISAAKCATNILFYDNCNPANDAVAKDNVKIGIVPFTIMVNVGTQFKDETWLDWKGKSMISSLNFDNDDNEDTPFRGPVNRTDLFKDTGSTWSGCVEARLAPYDTTDDEPVAPDKDNKLFLPLFSPDTVKTSTSSTTYNFGSNSYINDESNACVLKTCTVKTQNGKKTYTIKEGSVTYPSQNQSCIPIDAALMDGNSDNGTYSLLSVTELQERLCKYKNVTINSSSTNLNCPGEAILPLTTNATSVINKIGRMTAAGSTNIQQGTVWGMHGLTSTAPLTEAQPRNDGAVSKALIIMTDGSNDPPFQDNNRSSVGYFSWGFPNDGRLAENPRDIDNDGRLSDDSPDVTRASLIQVMDDKTLATCANAKALGIDVYTIGLGSSNSVKQMLQNCSSGTGYYYFPAKPADLNTVFQAIAGQLAQLRIAQ